MIRTKSTTYLFNYLYICVYNNNIIYIYIISFIINIRKYILLWFGYEKQAELPSCELKRFGFDGDSLWKALARAVSKPLTMELHVCSSICTHIYSHVVDVGKKITLQTPPPKLDESPLGLQYIHLIVIVIISNTYVHTHIFKQIFLDDQKVLPIKQ